MLSDKINFMVVLSFILDNNSVIIAVAQKMFNPKYIWNRYFRESIKNAVYGESGSGKTSILANLQGKSYL